MRLQLALLALAFSVHSASPADDRLPVPDEAAQREAAELVQEVFGEQIKAATEPNEKLALTTRLIEEARKSGDDPAARYALYRAALIASRDASAAMSVIEEMAKHFQIDEVKAGTFTLLRISKSAKPRSEQRTLAEACLKLVDVCLAEDRFASATKLGELAHSAALKSGDTDLRRLIRTTIEKISALQKRFQDVQAAVAVLEANPIHAKANLTVGHYYCLVKGDWERGIPMLALGSDEGLKELATRELKVPATSKEQVALADGWYLAAEKPGEANNERMLQRAAHWYRLSLKSDPALSSLLKTKVTKRLTSVESRLGELAPPTTTKPPAKKEKLVIGLTRTLQGQKGPVRSVAWSPDGKRLASGNRDKTVRVWDADGGKLLRTLQGHEDAVRGVAFDPDGKRLASGSLDNTVKIWDAVSGKLLASLRGHQGPVRSVAWSPDGKRLASGGQDKTVRIWGADSGKLLGTLEGHTGFVVGVAWSPDGKRLASGSQDKTIKVWAAASGKLLGTLQGHTGTVHGVTWSPDGKRLVSGSYDTTVRAWDAASGRLLATLQGHTGFVVAVAWSPGGKRLASSSDDGTVKVWEGGSGRLLGTLRGHTHAVWGVAWSPDGKRLVSGSHDGTVRVWNVVE